MSTIFVHGGAPKTGTSYVQVLFAQYTDALKKAGVIYPLGMTVDAAKEGKITSGNGIEFANYLQPSLPHKIKNKEAFAKTFAKTLRQAGGKKILYSSEFISFENKVRSENLINIARENNYKIKYIFLVRDLGSASYSSYSQRLKKRGEARSYTEFIETFDPGYANRIAKADRILGEDNVILFNYQEHMSRLGSLFFNDILGTNIVVEEQNRINRSLSPTEAQMLRFLNSVPQGTPKVVGRFVDQVSKINNEVTSANNVHDTAYGLAKAGNTFTYDRFASALNTINSRINGQPITSDMSIVKEFEERELNEFERTLLLLVAGLIDKT